MGHTKKNILAFIKKYIKENEYPPTFEEIGEAVGLLSRSTVHAHLHSLKKKGYISFIDGSPRTIRVLKK